MSESQITFGDIFELSPRSLVGTQELQVMSITMADGLIDQSEKFKKRVASRDLTKYRLVKYGELVIGFPNQVCEVPPCLLIGYPKQVCEVPPCLLIGYPKQVCEVPAHLAVNRLP